MSVTSPVRAEALIEDALFLATFGAQLTDPIAHRLGYANARSLERRLTHLATTDPRAAEALGMLRRNGEAS